jgi:hypothetical protein
VLAVSCPDKLFKSKSEALVHFPEAYQLLPLGGPFTKAISLSHSAQIFET